jgi:hypothetical protein
VTLAECFARVSRLSFSGHADSKRVNSRYDEDMLTYEPDLGAQILRDLEEASHEFIASQFVGMVPSLVGRADGSLSDLIMMQGSGSYLMIEAKKATECPILPTSSHVAHESAHLSMGQLGQWQEYRQELTIRARSLSSNLQSLDMLMWRGRGISNVWTATGTEDENSHDPDQLDVRAPSLHQPYAETAYFRSVQDELYCHFVSFVLQARTFVKKALTKYRDRIRVVSVVISTLHAVVFSPIIFCSVRWEKRRWFLLHGARPPKSTARAMWACLPEACSGSSLAY